MSEIEKGFVKQAQSELQQRIAKTDDICDQLKKGYTGYSPKIKRIFLLIVLGLLLVVFIRTIINIDVVYKIFSTREYGRDSMLVRMMLLCVCLYIILRIYNGIIRVLMTTKIDGHILKVKSIRKYLVESLSNINSIADDAKKILFGNTNQKINTKISIDTDIAKYWDIAETYSSLDDKTIGVSTLVLHWVSGILFSVVFLIISLPYVAGKLCVWLNINQYGIFSFIYILTFLFIFMALWVIYPINPGTFNKKQLANKPGWKPQRYFIDPQTYLKRTVKKNPPAKNRTGKKSLIGVASAVVILLGFGAYDGWFPGILSSAEKLIENGKKYYHVKDYDNAIKQLDDAVRFYPNYALGYAWRGETYRMKEQYDIAVIDFNDAIRLDSSYAWAIARRGEAYLMEEQYDAAITDFNEAIRLDPNYAWAYARRGDSYRMKNQYDTAICDFNEAIRLDPKDAWAYARRGETYRRQDQYDTAIKDFNQAIKLDPNFSFAYAFRGETYRMKKQYDTAIRDFNEAIRLDPKNAWAYGSRGQVYRQRNQRRQAIQDFEKALSLDPNLEWARKELGEIR